MKAESTTFEPPRQLDHILTTTQVFHCSMAMTMIDALILNIEHILHIVLVFPLLTWNK